MIVTNEFPLAVLTLVGTCDATVYVVVNVAGGVADAGGAKTATVTDVSEVCSDGGCPNGPDGGAA